MRQAFAVGLSTTYFFFYIQHKTSDNHEFKSLRNNRFPAIKFTFEIKNKEQPLILDVPVTEILPISWNFVENLDLLGIFVVTNALMFIPRHQATKLIT